MIVVYRPVIGGSPANSAYAMPCGTSRVVSTTPATRSLTSQRRWYPLSARPPGGTRSTTASAEGAAGLAQPLLHQDRHERLHPGAGEDRERLVGQPADRMPIAAVLRVQPVDERLDEGPDDRGRGVARPVVLGGEHRGGHGHLAPPRPVDLGSERNPPSVAPGGRTGHHPCGMKGPVTSGNPAARPRVRTARRGR